MVTRDADGNLVAPYLPTVGGTGPLGTHAGPAPLERGEPIYASYWRLYTVEIPATARVFGRRHPPDRRSTRRGISRPLASARPDDRRPTARRIVGRVVLNPGCTYIDPMAAGPRGLPVPRLAGRRGEQHRSRRDPADRHHGHLSVPDLPGRHRAGADHPMRHARGSESRPRVARFAMVGARAFAQTAVRSTPWRHRRRSTSRSRSTTATATRRRRDAAPAFSINGYVDVGFAKAQGDGTSFAPGDHARPGRLRRRHLRAGGELARRRGVDRLERAVRERLPAALGGDRRQRLVPAQHAGRRPQVHAGHGAADDLLARAVPAALHGHRATTRASTSSRRSGG